MQMLTAQPPAGGEAMAPFGTESDWENVAVVASYGSVLYATNELLIKYPGTEPGRVRRFVGDRRQAINAGRHHKAEEDLRRFVNYALIMRGMP